uniref:Reverse transcriptase Ty1/copia-type domain-containing protein n=1 Tax=Fagus sylvatica TaxID=28930 RepID=A0A2N9HLR0_FAGSY
MSSNPNATPMILLSNITNLVSVKLDQTNYMLWKFQITSTLKAYKLLDVVDGSYPCPEMYNRDTNALALVIGQKSAKGVWDTLEKRFTSLSRSNVLSLKRDLNSIKKNNDSINVYMQKIKECKDKLEAVGVFIEAEELLYIVLDGLPTEFYPFCSAMRTRNDSVSFEELHVLMLGEEKSLTKNTESSKDSLHMAMVGQGPKGNTGNNTPIGSIQSSISVQIEEAEEADLTTTEEEEEAEISTVTRGGFNNFSPQPSTYNSQPSSRPTCQICYKNGHTALDCYHRMDFAFQGKHPPTKLAAMAFSSNASSSNCWVSDTGATDHFTPDLANLQQARDYNGNDAVTVGNGQQLPITHIDNNCCFHFDASKFSIQDIPSGKVLYKGFNEAGLYPIYGDPFPSTKVQTSCPTFTKSALPSFPRSAYTATRVSASTWHSRLGHPHSKILQSVFQHLPTSTIDSSSSNSFLDYLDVEPPSFSIASALTPWVTAMEDEFSALHRQGTWSLVPHDNSQNIVGCKWVYKLLNQPQFESFLPWLLTILGLSDNLTSAMPSYMAFSRKMSTWLSPKASLILSGPIMCANSISLYMDSSRHPEPGLKDSPHQLETLGFHASTADPSLFTFKANHDTLYLLLYVDDIIITGTSPSLITNLIHQLQTTFELKDLGPLHYFLGLQLHYHSTGFSVHQTKYASDLLQRFAMTNCKPSSTPYSSTSRLTKDQGTPLVDPTSFRSLVGALQYLTFTRPDLSFAVNQVCQFMHSPTDTHLIAAKRILRYVKGSLSSGLLFQPGSLNLQAYADADWAGDPIDRRSTSGYVVFLGSTPITWVSKKQCTVSRSSTEAEYRSLASATAEVFWIRMVLKDLGIFLPNPPILWCDNLSALALASNPVFHARTKHIEVDYHFIREKVVRRDVVVKFISTTDQLADILTKCLPSPSFHRLRANLLHPFRPP